MPRSWLAAGCLAFCALCLAAAPASADLALASRPSAGGGTQAGAVRPPIADWQWWEDTKTWFSRQASNRSRVVQFGLAGMVVALLILYSASQRKR